MKRAYIPVVTRSETVIVYLDDIFFLQQEQRRLHIHTRRHSYVFYHKLEDLIPLFYEDKFYRCHKSCVVNFEKVKAMSEGSVFFEDGTVITLGRESFRCARRFFNQFLKKREPAMQAQRIAYTKTP